MKKLKKLQSVETAKPSSLAIHKRGSPRGLGEQGNMADFKGNREKILGNTGTLKQFCGSREQTLSTL